MATWAWHVPFGPVCCLAPPVPRAASCCLVPRVPRAAGLCVFLLALWRHTSHAWLMLPPGFVCCLPPSHRVFLLPPGSACSLGGLDVPWATWLRVFLVPPGSACSMCRLALFHCSFKYLCRLAKGPTGPVPVILVLLASTPPSFPRAAWFPRVLRLLPAFECSCLAPLCCLAPRSPLTSPSFLQVA